MTTTTQTSLFAYEKQRPVPKGKSATLNALVRDLGLAKVAEPQPTHRGTTWNDDAQISTPHYTRENIDSELNEYELE